MNVQKYEGERNSRGERNGFGKAFLSNGDIYVGCYSDGLRHGKGLYKFKNGSSYDGEWRHGLKFGNGTFIYPNNSQYQGVSTIVDRNFIFLLINNIIEYYLICC